MKLAIIRVPDSLGWAIYDLVGDAQAHNMTPEDLLREVKECWVERLKDEVKRVEKLKL
jgi:hypothetical protein